MPRKAIVSRPEIFAAAIELIDEVGLEAMTMRKLGERLGVEAMTVYNYVANRDAVLDGVYETVLAEVTIPETTDDVRDDLSGLAYGLRRVFARHPRVLPLFFSRPAITTASLRYVEWTLQRLATVLPQPERRVYAFQTLAAFVLGITALQHQPQLDEGPDYGALPAEEFPELHRVATTGAAGTTDAEFDFGLRAVLDGVLGSSARGPGSDL
ncbi:MAG: TetR/AcrR family transcriptional regulator C-terminal domain-containing protein [Myxococcota bacterium]